MSLASSEKPESRSHKAVLSWQLAGILNGLRSTVPNGLEPGKRTIELLKAVRRQIEAKGEMGLGLYGVAIDNIPQLEYDATPVEVLVVTEALHALISCLLEPDERKEQQRGMGFHTVAKADE
jgi:hypothetical protein